MAKLTVLYDNYPFNESLKNEWGFSCLVEGFGKVVLFDTGGNAEVLENNFSRMEINPDRIDCVVISHMHWDHIKGLEWLVTANNHLEIYLPASAEDEYVQRLEEAGVKVERLAQRKMICESVITTGTFEHKIPEQALCLQTKEGVVVIAGCSHPGIVQMLQAITQVYQSKIELVMGGFHLKDHKTDQINEIVSEIKNLPINKIAPTHCTGDEAMAAFKNAWQDKFVQLGVGNTIQL